MIFLINLNFINIKKKYLFILMIAIASSYQNTTYAFEADFAQNNESIQKMIDKLFFNNQIDHQKTNEKEDKNSTLLESAHSDINKNLALITTKKHLTSSAKCIELKKDYSHNSNTLDQKSSYTSKDKDNSQITIIADSSSLSEQFAYISDDFGKYVQTIIDNINNYEFDKLSMLFHPRLKASEQAIRKSFKNDALIGVPHKKYNPVSASLIKIFAIYNHNHTSDDIFCKEHDMYLSGQYGYKLQFFIWINLMNDYQVSRLMINVVPSKSNLYFGVFFLQPWTHENKDYKQWMNLASTDEKNNKPMSAYIKYDLAKRLMFGGSFFRLKDEDRLKEHMLKYLNHNVWLDKLKKTLPSNPRVFLVKANSVLTDKGIGLMMRFALDRLWSTVEIKQHCNSVIKVLNKQAWFDTITGIRCGYNTPYETDYKKDGALGSIYLDKNDFRK